MGAVSVLMSWTPRSMPTPPPKPIIFISYARADEAKEPVEGEAKGFSFVTGYLRPAEEIGAFEIWTEPLAPSLTGLPRGRTLMIDSSWTRADTFIRNRGIVSVDDRDRCRSS
jgi:hypothetical protein